MTLIKNRQGDIKEGLVYDPAVKDYDETFFKTITGTPVISGGNLRLNAEACTSYSQFLYGEFHFKANVATTPSAGEAKHWGLRHSAMTIGSMFFDITAAVFSFKSYNEENTVESTTIAWNPTGLTWEATMVDFEIVWTEQNIKAYVDGVLKATHAVGDNNLPQPIALSNSDADNFDVDYIIANKLGKWIT